MMNEIKRVLVKTECTRACPMYIGAGSCNETAMDFDLVYIS